MVFKAQLQAALSTVSALRAENERLRGENSVLVKAARSTIEFIERKLAPSEDATRVETLLIDACEPARLREWAEYEHGEKTNISREPKP
jgi:hypothetical protein